MAASFDRMSLWAQFRGMRWCEFAEEDGEDGRDEEYNVKKGPLIIFQDDDLIRMRRGPTPSTSTKAIPKPSEDEPRASRTPTRASPNPNEVDFLTHKWMQGLRKLFHTWTSQSRHPGNSLNGSTLISYVRLALKRPLMPSGAVRASLKDNGFSELAKKIENMGRPIASPQDNLEALGLKPAKSVDSMKRECVESEAIDLENDADSMHIQMQDRLRYLTRGIDITTHKRHPSNEKGLKGEILQRISNASEEPLIWQRSLNNETQRPMCSDQVAQKFKPTKLGLRDEISGDEEEVENFSATLWGLYEDIQNGIIPLNEAFEAYRDVRWEEAISGQIFNVGAREITPVELARFLQSFGLPDCHIRFPSREPYFLPVESPFSGTRHYPEEAAKTEESELKYLYTGRRYLRELANHVRLLRYEKVGVPAACLMIDDCLKGLNVERSTMISCLGESTMSPLDIARMIWDEAIGEITYEEVLARLAISPSELNRKTGKENVPESADVTGQTVLLPSIELQSSLPSESPASATDPTEPHSRGLNAGSISFQGERFSLSPENGVSDSLFGLQMPTKEARALGLNINLPRTWIDREIHSITPHRSTSRRVHRERVNIILPSSKRKASNDVTGGGPRKTPRLHNHADIFAREGEDQATFVKSFYPPGTFGKEESTPIGGNSEAIDALNRRAGNMPLCCLQTSKNQETNKDLDELNVSASAQAAHKPFVAPIVRSKGTEAQTCESDTNLPSEFEYFSDGQHREPNSNMSSKPAGGESAKSFGQQNPEAQICEGDAVAPDKLDYYSDGEHREPVSNELVKASETSIANSPKQHDSVLPHLSALADNDDLLSQLRVLERQVQVDINSIRVAFSTAYMYMHWVQDGFETGSILSMDSENDKEVLAILHRILDTHERWELGTIETMPTEERLNSALSPAEGQHTPAAETSPQASFRRDSVPNYDALHVNTRDTPKRSARNNRILTSAVEHFVQSLTQSCPPSAEMRPEGLVPDSLPTTTCLLPKGRVAKGPSWLQFGPLPFGPLKPEPFRVSPELKEDRSRNTMSRMARFLKTPNQAQEDSERIQEPDQVKKDTNQAEEDPHKAAKARMKKEKAAFDARMKRKMVQKGLLGNCKANSQVVSCRFFQNSNTALASSATPALNRLFDKYRDNPAAEPDHIGVEGSMRYLTDLGVKLDEAVLLAVLTELNAPTMGELTREGFVNGWTNRRAETLTKQQQDIPSLRRALPANPSLFKRVYKTTFLLARTPGSKVIPLETAIEYWRLLLSEPSVSWSTASTPWLEWWIEYLETKFKKAVNRDVWDQTGVFVQKCGEDETMGWWSEDQAWPTPHDEFVAFAKAKREGEGKMDEG